MYRYAETFFFLIYSSYLIQSVYILTGAAIICNCRVILRLCRIKTVSLHPYYCVRFIIYTRIFTQQWNPHQSLMVSEHVTSGSSYLVDFKFRPTHGIPTLLSFSYIFHVGIIVSVLSVALTRIFISYVVYMYVSIIYTCRLLMPRKIMWDYLLVNVFSSWKFLSALYFVDFFANEHTCNLILYLFELELKMMYGIFFILLCGLLNVYLCICSISS